MICQNKIILKQKNASPENKQNFNLAVTLAEIKQSGSSR